MRESCIDCVIKHIQAASIFIHEAKFGYPDHCYDAIGELYHAECELEGLSMKVAQEIRDIRKAIETEEGADFNVAELRAKVLAVEDKQEGETMSGMTPERMDQFVQAVGLATTAYPQLKMNPDDPIGMMREVVAYTDQLRDVIDRAAKHWLSLEPGVPGWHGALDGAMKAAVGEIERLRGECAKADMELSKVENPFPPNADT